MPLTRLEGTLLGMPSVVIQTRVSFATDAAMGTERSRVFVVDFSQPLVVRVFMSGEVLIRHEDFAAFDERTPKLPACAGTDGVAWCQRRCAVCQGLVTGSLVVSRGRGEV